MGCKAWWELEPNTAHQSVVDTFRALDADLTDQRQKDLKRIRMYSERMYEEITGDRVARRPGGSSRMYWNVIKSVIDTATAEMAGANDRTQFLTEGGTRKQRIEGESIGDVVVAARLAAKMETQDILKRRDAMIMGIGWQEILPDYSTGCFKARRVLNLDIAYDRVAARDDNVTELYRYRRVDAESLAAEYPDLAEEIMGSGKISREHIATDRSYEMAYEAAPRVGLIHAVKLPRPKPNGEVIPGRRILACEKATLIDEEWDYNYFPWIPYVWNDAVAGIVGDGMVDDLAPKQLEINFLNQRIQTTMTLNAAQVWVDKGSNVNIAQLDNRDVGIRTYTGRPPSVISTNMVPAEWLQERERIRNMMFEESGVNQMAATGEKPAGLNSGTALRTYTHIGSKRMLYHKKRFRQHTVDVDRAIVDALKAVAEVQEDADVKVPLQGRPGFEKIKLSEINLDRDAFMLRPFPVNFLPDEPAGQIETLKEFGEMSPAIRDQLVSSLSYPDLKNAVNVAEAPRKYVEMIIDRALNDGERTAPTPHVLPNVVIPLVSIAILQAEIDGEPLERVDILRRYLAEYIAMPEVQAAVAPPPPPNPQGPMPPAPPAPPMPPMPGPGAPVL